MMKRSEMIDVIEKCWVDSTSFISDRATAEYILKAIERSGMNPPLRIPEFTDYGEPNTIGEYTWEKEDE